MLGIQSGNGLLGYPGEIQYAKSGVRVSGKQPLPNCGGIRMGIRELTWNSYPLPSTLTNGGPSGWVGDTAIIARTTANGAVYVSKDNGKTWQQTTTPAAYERKRLLHNGRVWVLTTGHNVTGAAIYRSYDGITWEQRNLPISGFWYGCCVGMGGRLVMSAYNNASGYYSDDDGVTWTTTSLVSSTTWRSMVMLNNVLALFNDSSQYRLSYDNGATWSAGLRTISPVAGAGLNPFVVNGECFVQVVATGEYLVSRDLLTWTTLSRHPDGADWQDHGQAGYPHNGEFFISNPKAGDLTRPLVSTDGRQWYRALQQAPVTAGRFLIGRGRVILWTNSATIYVGTLPGVAP